jgi:hypothetical protein
MCKFCNNSGVRLETYFNEEEQETADFQFMIYGGKYLRVSSDKVLELGYLQLAHAGSLEINYCPMCGKKLENYMMK